MAYSDSCPYKELTMKPCYTCTHHVPDIDGCSLNYIASRRIEYGEATGMSAQSYEERLRDYEKKRQEYLILSKEALVDLIIHRPTIF